jgi:hypothetical protein
MVQQTIFRFFPSLLVLAFCAAAGRDITPPLHAFAAIELYLDAPADVTFPLFGPVRESEWAPEWAPAWIYPSMPRQSSEGAVFTTTLRAGVATWVMTSYDVEERAVEYVNFIPGYRVTQISITVRPDTTATSIARVSYRVTALSHEGSAFVAHCAKEFPSEGPHGEKSINDSISKSGLHPGADRGAVPVKPN